MTAAIVSRWSRRHVLVSVLSLIAWQVGTVTGIQQPTEVRLAVFGFILHMVFGKAYSLVPAYFDRELAFPRAPAVQFPLTVAGAAGLVGAALQVGPTWLGTVGAVLWTLGVCVFLGALFWSVRGNLTGHETATGEPNAGRRSMDRLANGFVPVALLYLAVGTYGTLAAATGLPLLLDGYPPRVTHLLAAGTAGLLVFALGFRLFPRFTVVTPPRSLVAVVLSAGALGPAVLATHLGDPPWLQVGALVEAVAVVGFAAGTAILFGQSDRRRVGFYAVLAGAASGVAAVVLGLSFAFGPATPTLVRAHLRLNLLGFLGLTIIGTAYQFYPPTVGTLQGASDRTALASILCVGGGLLCQVVGLVGHRPRVATFGEFLALAGVVLYGYLLVAAFRAR